MKDLQNIKQRFAIIGNYEELNRAIDIAVQVAPTDLSVLITGESGTGKEIFPQVIHNYSTRKHGPYRKEQLILNSLDTRKVHLPEPAIAERAILKLPMVEQYSLMRWQNCRYLLRYDYSEFLKRVSSFG
jgi:hypothetical protein